MNRFSLVTIYTTGFLTVIALAVGPSDLLMEAQGASLISFVFSMMLD